MKSKILCWNIAGVRARIRKGNMDFLAEGEYDIVCLQETKALESEVNMTEELATTYPYRFWKSCTGEDQRKGLSGTAIWCKNKPKRELEPLSLGATEGRTVALEFNDFILVTVYTPNSQCAGTERNVYREALWDQAYREWAEQLNKIKPTILCGDFNVANERIDLHKPDKWHRCAGFLDGERDNFKELLNAGWKDAFRLKYPDKPNQYTFWNQRCPWERKANIGWRIDYFLVPKQKQHWIKDCCILANVMGSDHCPITLEVNTRRKKLVIVDNL